MSANDLTDIIERLKISCRYISDAALARAIGLSPQNFNSRKKSGGIKEILILHAIDKGINKGWLLTGEGDMFVQNNSIREQSAYYNSGNTFSPEITGTDAIDNFSELMGMAGAVLNSGTIYADALSQNIRAFHHGVNNEIDPGRKRKTLPGHPPGVVDGGRKKASG
jgi:hypothetical protein